MGEQVPRRRVYLLQQAPSFGAGLGTVFAAFKHHIRFATFPANIRIMPAWLREVLTMAALTAGFWTNPCLASMTAGTAFAAPFGSNRD